MTAERASSRHRAAGRWPHSHVCVHRAEHSSMRPGGGLLDSREVRPGLKWAEDRDRPSPNKAHGRQVSTRKDAARHTSSGKWDSNSREMPPRTVGTAQVQSWRRHRPVRAWTPGSLTRRWWVRNAAAPAGEWGGFPEDETDSNRTIRSRTTWYLPQGLENLRPHEHPHTGADDGPGTGNHRPNLEATQTSFRG